MQDEIDTSRDGLPDFTIEPWRPLFDLGLDSQKTGDHETGRWACECLLSLDDVPDEFRRAARINQLFFTPLLPALVPSLTVEPVLFETPPLWSRYNPSVAVDGAGYRLLVHSSNFGGDPSHRVLTEDGIARTTHYIVFADQSMTPRLVERIEGTIDGADPAATCSGDCRLFQWQGDWYVTSTRHASQHGEDTVTTLMQCQDTAFRQLQSLRYPATSAGASNWMPFIVDDELLFLSSCQPTVVLHYRNGETEELITEAGPVITRDFLGSSQGVAVDDGFLFITHESVPLEDGTPVYPHRFILLDRDFRISQLSIPFFFLHRSRELCCGMARRDEKLMISFGFLDREAFVATVPLPEVLAALRPVYG